MPRVTQLVQDNMVLCPFPLSSPRIVFPRFRRTLLLFLFCRNMLADYYAGLKREKER